MDCAVNSQFKFGTHMVILTHTGGFWSCDPQNNLSKKASPIFSYSDRTNTRLFAKRDQAARHKCTIGCPGWALIGYPPKKRFNTSTQYFSILPEF